MTVTLRRHSFSKAEREVLVEAITTGAHVEEIEGLEEVALTIAEKLPELLAKARLSDTSENRRRIIDLVLLRWAMPKSPRPSHAYRRLAGRC